MLICVLSVSLFLCFFVPIKCSPCTDYNTLGNTTKRVLTNDVLPSTDASELLCDDVDGWYRLETGQIALSCVKQYRCGTQAPIWLNDSVPPVHRQENKTFCVDHAGANQKNKCCTFTRQMPVMNCGEFLVIKLTSSKILCPSAICIDPNDHVPGVSLSGPYLYKRDFFFKCEFNKDLGNPRKTANVTWLFDGLPVKSEIMNYTSKVAIFESADWAGHVGSSLSCKVNSNNTEYESAAYWGGIKIEARPNRIREGEETRLTIQSTLPITCGPRVSDKDCHLDLDFIVDGEKSYSGIFGVGACNATLQRSNWNNDTLMVETTMAIVSSIDPVVKPNISRLLAVEAVKGQNIPDLWKTLNSNTTIVQTDVEHANCFLFGQNHIRGTKSQLFALNSTGDFLMFKSKDENFQIQTRHMMVGDSYPSTCAVAFEYYGHVITVDMCRAHGDDNTETVITQRGDLNSGMYTSHCGMADLELSTDTDIRVEVKVQRHNLDINVHLPPSLKPGQQGGFCTNSKPVRTGDLFKAKDSDIWRSANNPSKFCDCVSDTSKCKTSLSRHVTAPIADPIENMMYFCNNTKLHKDLPRKDEVIGNIKPPVHEWTDPGRNESEATMECQRALETLVPAYCRQSVAGVVPGFSSFKQTCMDDIKNSGSLDYVKSSLQGFLWECQINLLKNPDNYMRNHDQYIPPAEVTSDMCPDFCNMHGVCKRGSCHCENGTLGEDCGVLFGATPTIVDILGGTSCESNVEDCSTPVLFIRDALRTVTAKLQPIRIEGGKTNAVNNEIVKNLTLTSRHGSRIDITPIMAYLNDSTAYGVNFTLSNDGVKYGNSFQYYVYDEICHKCLMEENQWMCFEMDTGCRINGKCYKNGTLNPQNPSLKCKPDCALMKWSTDRPC